MLNRQVILALCVLVSIAVHAALFYFAPNVILFDTPPVPRSILQIYRIQLEERGRADTIAPAARSAADLASRPGSIRDLLERDAVPIEPASAQAAESAPVPDLPQRVAQESLERAYDFAENSETIRRIDARILEIAEETARDEVQVARRLVRPSPERLVPEGILPVLRRPDRPGETAPLPLIAAPLTSSSPAEPSENMEELLPPEAERPPYEADVVAPVAVELARVAPPVEETVARAPVEREIQQVRSERDFEALDDLVRFELDAYAPPGQAEGYFRLQILPRSDTEIPPLPKDVTFVVDASKSISQPKLNATTDGLKRTIALLRPEDHFNVVIFRDAPSSFQPVPVPATAQNKAAAQSFLTQLSATGQTDVYKGIHPVVAQTPTPGKPSLVVVLSDGRPTTGMLDGRTIINGLTADNNLRNSIFAFAGGRTVNRYLLDLLAYRNKGEAYVVDGVTEIPEALPVFFQRYQEPLLVELRADYGRIDESKVYPQVVPDFFKDRAVTIYGRYDRLQDKDFFMRLTGQAQDQAKELIFRTSFEDAATGDQSIARNWAFQKSYHIIGQMVTQGETPELKAELRRLELEYNIRTSYSE